MNVSKKKPTPAFYLFYLPKAYRADLLIYCQVCESSRAVWLNSDRALFPIVARSAVKVHFGVCCWVASTARGEDCRIEMRGEGCRSARTEPERGFGCEEEEVRAIREAKGQRFQIFV